jgi:hypothetical protein
VCAHSDLAIEIGAFVGLKHSTKVKFVRRVSERKRMNTGWVFGIFARQFAIEIYQNRKGKVEERTKDESRKTKLG